jgi:hypothetical protein
VCASRQAGEGGRHRAELTPGARPAPAAGRGARRPPTAVPPPAPCQKQDGTLTSEELLRSLALDGAVSEDAVDSGVFSVRGGAGAGPGPGGGGCAAGVFPLTILNAAGQGGLPDAGRRSHRTQTNALLSESAANPQPPATQVFDSNGNGRVEAEEWQKGLGDLGPDGEAAKRCAARARARAPGASGLGAVRPGAPPHSKQPDLNSTPNLTHPHPPQPPSHPSYIFNRVDRLTDSKRQLDASDFGTALILARTVILGY